ncbi:chaplin family protein, partial [Streptomyces sp. NPDC058735]|uniref:chaplin n=1 Tax=Streptomyces sp. NPDC058735 TaxID=3346616 RepID=UPI0036CDABB9
NEIQAPVHVPVNACGNTIDAVAVLNPAFGNSCVNEDGSYGDDGGYGDTPSTEPPQTPPAEHPHTPPSGGHSSTPPDSPSGEHPTPPGRAEQPPSLPETGAGEMVGTAAASTALIAGGIILYRRGRAARTHR